MASQARVLSTTFLPLPCWTLKAKPYMYLETPDLCHQYLNLLARETATNNMELKGQGWATLKMTDAEMETICAMHCYTFHVIKQFQKVKLFAIHNSWVRRDDSRPMEQPPPFQQRQMSLQILRLALP